MKPKFQQAFMDVAQRFAELSSARRLKVGAIIVKDNRIISLGYNGMPSGWDNNCEDVVWSYDQRDITDEWQYCENRRAWWRLKTKPEALHAESNAISKLARSAESGEAADLFVTHSPCLDCAKLIFQSGIGRVFFKNHYRDDQGLKFLRRSGVEVTEMDQ